LRTEGGLQAASVCQFPEGLAGSGGSGYPIDLKSSGRKPALKAG